jgi:putative inorganic carbon (HCO3(-)) transporter
VGLFLCLIAPLLLDWSRVTWLTIPAPISSLLEGTFTDLIHPNVLAGSLLIILPLALGWVLFGWSRLPWIERILFSLAALAMAGVVVITQSRGAWLALGAVLVALPVLRWRWGWILLLLVAAFGILAALRLGFNPLIEAVASGGAIEGMNDRLDIWSRTVFMIQDFPLTGIGMGTFTQVADALYPFSLALPGTIYHAHNLFLQVAVDLGIPGLIAWLAVLLVAAACAWQLYRAEKTKRGRLAAGLGAGLLCSLLAMSVHGLTDAVTWGMVRPAPLVWVICGLAVAAWKINAEKA